MRDEYRLNCCGDPNCMDARCRFANAKLEPLTIYVNLYEKREIKTMIHTNKK